MIPGQTLRTDMWKNNTRIHFETTVLENNSKVLTGGYMDLKEVKTPSVLSRNLCSAITKMESDAIFDQMADYVKKNPEQAKKINGVFHYIITKNGDPKVEWSRLSFSLFNTVR